MLLSDRVTCDLFTPRKKVLRLPHFSQMSLRKQSVPTRFVAKNNVSPGLNRWPTHTTSYIHILWYVFTHLHTLKTHTLKFPYVSIRNSKIPMFFCLYLSEVSEYLNLDTAKWSKLFFPLAFYISYSAIFNHKFGWESQTV